MKLTNVVIKTINNLNNIIQEEKLNGKINNRGAN